MPPEEAKERSEALLGQAMLRYLSGEIEGFDTIYDFLAGPLRGFLRARCRNDALADDLVQETFLQMHRSRKTYEPGRPVTPWAYAIAHHVFLMHHRAAGRRERFLDAFARHHDATIDRSRDAGDAYAERDRVRRALVGVPSDQREIVELHHVQGWSFGEIAARLGIRVNAARTRAFRGLKRLRDGLERQR